MVVCTYLREFWGKVVEYCEVIVLEGKVSGKLLFILHVVLYFSLIIIYNNIILV